MAEKVDAHLLIAGLHRAALLRLSAATGTPLQGLHVGGSRLKLSNAWRRRLRIWDAALGLAEKISAQSLPVYLAQLDVEIERSSCAKNCTNDEGEAVQKNVNSGINHGTSLQGNIAAQQNEQQITESVPAAATSCAGAQEAGVAVGRSSTLNPLAQEFVPISKCAEEPTPVGSQEGGQGTGDQNDKQAILVSAFESFSEALSDPMPRSWLIPISDVIETLPEHVGEGEVFEISKLVGSVTALTKFSRDEFRRGQQVPGELLPHLLNLEDALAAFGGGFIEGFIVGTGGDR